MELPRLSSAGEFFGNVRDRIPLGKRDRRDDYYDDFYDEEAYYSEEDDFGPYGFDDSYGNGLDEPEGPGYYDSGYPQLVNSDDIRASVRRGGRTEAASTRGAASELGAAPAQESAAAPASSRFASFSAEGTPEVDVPEYVSPYQRTLVENPPRPMSPAEKVAAKAEATGGFTRVGASSTAATASTSAASSTTPSYAGASASSNAAFDPFSAYQESRSFSRMPTRKLTTMKPMSYDDVQGIARAVRAGDAVVLVLRMTNSDLSRRILDFSFGVASALNARVECVAEKVFIITTGPELSSDEKRRLNQEGVL